MIRSFQFFIGGGSIAKACFNLTGFFYAEFNDALIVDDVGLP